MEVLTYGGIWGKNEEGLRRVLLSVWAPLWNLGRRGSIYWDLWEILKRGLRKWSISHTGSLLGEPGNGLNYWGPYKLSKVKLWSRESLGLEVQLDNVKSAHFSGTLWDGWRGDMECSVYICVNTLRGTWRVVLLLRTLKIVKIIFWRRTSLSILTPFVNLEMGLFTGDFVRWMKGAPDLEYLFWGRSVYLNWREWCFLGTPNDTLNKALEMDVCFHRSPAFEEHEETLLS